MSRSTISSTKDTRTEATPAPSPENVEPTVLGGAVGIIDEAAPAVQGSVVRTGGQYTGPKIERFRITNGGHVMLDGMRVPMRVGKEVSGLTYDLRALRAQGIKMELITDDE